MWSSEQGIGRRTRNWATHQLRFSHQTQVGNDFPAKLSKDFEKRNLFNSGYVASIEVSLEHPKEAMAALPHAWSSATVVYELVRRTRLELIDVMAEHTRTNIKVFNTVAWRPSHQIKTHFAGKPSIITQTAAALRNSSILEKTLE